MTRPVTVKQRSTPWIAWLLLGVTVITTASMYGLIAAGCNEVLTGGYLAVRSSPFVFAISNLLFSLLGVLILYRQPGHVIGWLCAIIGVLGGIQFYSWVHSSCMALPLPAIALTAWIFYVTSPIQLIPMFALMPMLFPNGHFLSPRWRALTLISCSLIGALFIVMATLPGPMVMNGMDLGLAFTPDNPFALSFIPISIGPRVNALLNALGLGLSLAGILSLFIRYRRSQGVVRQQLKWIAYFFVVAFGTQLLFFELPGAFITPSVFEGLPYLIILAIVFVGYPVVIGIAILRYRLYDIDVIIRRTLVYAAVTGTLALVYVGSIIVLQRLFVAITGQQSTVAIVVSTLLIAALFNPLRRRVQALIDRRFYRRKYDAELTLARFGAVARDEVDLEALTTELLGAVDRTVQPSGTTLWLRDRQP